MKDTQDPVIKNLVICKFEIQTGKITFVSENTHLTNITDRDTLLILWEKYGIFSLNVRLKL